MPMQDDFKPIFIVGNERSGTTMLAGLLDRHSEVAIPPETHFLYGLNRRLRRIAETQSNHEQLIEEVYAAEHWAAKRMLDMGLDKADLLERFKRYPAERRYLLRAALEQYATERDKQRIGEKSPHHLLYVPTLVRWYPQARIVCIVRDGRDVALSLRRAPWTHDSLARHSLAWRRLVKTGLDFEKKYPANLLRVCFEDLVREPERELRRIDAFAGLEFEPRQLDHTVATNVAPVWEKPWKEKVNQPLDPKRIAAWRDSAGRDEIWLMNSLMGDYLRRLGYPETEMIDCPVTARARLRLLGLVTRLLYNKPLYPVLRSIRKFVTGKHRVSLYP